MRLLLDASPLLILIVGRSVPKQFRRHKKTGDFSLDDFDQIEQFLQLFQSYAVTPHVLAEVSNQLSGGLVGISLRNLELEFTSIIQDLEECTIAAKALEASIVHRLGLVDTALSAIADTDTWLLTADKNLHNHMISLGLNSSMVSELGRA
jgi:hypothetical protein